MSAPAIHDALRLAALLSLLLPAAAIDLRSRRIPNLLTGPAALVALALGLACEPAALPGRLLAAAVAGGLLLLAAVVRPDGMGMGDVKLTAVLGLLLGPPVAVALLVALTSATAVGILVARGRWRTATLPLAPFLAVGAIVAFATA